MMIILPRRGHLVVFGLCLGALATTVWADSGVSLQENAACMTPNNKAGKCISIYDCSVLYEQLTNAKQSVANYIRDSDCGVHQSVPLVCCGDDVDYDDDHKPSLEVRNRTRSTISLATRFGDDSSESSNLIATRQECGYMVDQDRITNGLVTSIDEFPWMALLQYRKLDGTGRRYLCGGSLIGSRYVLTAAHCVTGEIERRYNLVGVRLGEHNLLEDPDCIRYGMYMDCADPPVDVGISRVISHPRYDESVREKPHDIALIKLDREISYTDFVRPICLPTIYDESSVGDRLFVAGWGRTESKSASEVKLKVEVPLTTRRYCRNMFRRAGANIRDTQICAGGEQGRDSCTGDSGGPLMTRLSESASQWYLEGIVSFGTVCGMKGWPGVYTKVNAYLGWIERVAV